MTETQQKHASILGYLVAMLALGAVGLSIVGALVEYRTGQPLAPAETAQVVDEDVTPLRMLALGGARAAELAVHHLERNERSQAVHAMDAASRVAMIARHAVEEEGRVPFLRASNDISAGREALQRSQIDQAVEYFEAAAAVLADAGADGSTTPRGADRWPAFAGARIVNAYGVRIGTLQQLRAGEGGRVEAVLRLGGTQDFLGFIDLGGDELVVPADRLLYGKAQTVGPTMVAIPTFEYAASAIRGE